MTTAMETMEEEDISLLVMTMLTMEVVAEEEEEDSTIRLEVTTTAVTMGATSSTSRIISKEILVAHITMVLEESILLDLEFTQIVDLDELEILYK